MVTSRPELKPVILIFVKYYLPAFKCGGPVRTIANLVERLGNAFEFRIVCSDRDSLESVSFANIAVDTWNKVGNASVFYASPGFMRVGKLRQLLGEMVPDVLYFNSFFSPRFTLLPLLVGRLVWGERTPVIVAPRGEFAASALRIRKLKKKIYTRASRLFGVYRNVTWQASSEYEAADIKRTVKVSEESVTIAPDLGALVKGEAGEQVVDPSGDDDVLRVVFLARVSVVKNLDFALQVVSRVRVPMIFDVYGLMEEKAYWERCQALADELPDHVSFSYRGVVAHEQVRDVLASYDLSFLPTQGENFGHAILEALSAGTPTLISDRTPWRDLDQTGVGWVRPLDDPDAFVSVLESVASESREDRLLRRKRASAYARSVAGDENIIARNVELFLSVVKRSAR